PPGAAEQLARRKGVCAARSWPRQVSMGVAHGHRAAEPAAAHWQPARRRRHVCAGAARAGAFTPSASVIVVGLMSGTSVDGIDAAVVDISADGDALHMQLLGYSE